MEYLPIHGSKFMRLLLGKYFYMDLDLFLLGWVFTDWDPMGWKSPCFICFMGFITISHHFFLGEYLLLLFPSIEQANLRWLGCFEQEIIFDMFGYILVKTIREYKPWRHCHLPTQISWVLFSILKFICMFNHVPLYHEFIASHLWTSPYTSCETKIYSTWFCIWIGLVKQIGKIGWNLTNIFIYSLYLNKTLGIRFCFIDAAGSSVIH